MRLIGIDPGTHRVGYGVIDAEGNALTLVHCGTLTVSDRTGLPDRLLVLYDGLLEVIERFKPAQSAVEDLYSGRSARSSIVIGEGRGVALLALAKAGLPVESIPPARIKKAITGNGNARKEQVADMVVRILRIPSPLTEPDTSDALAIALALAFRLSRNM